MCSEYSPHRGAGLTIPTRCGQYPKGVGVLPEALPELLYNLFLARTGSREGGGGGWDGSRNRPETADLFWKEDMKYVILYSKSMTDCVLEKYNIEYHKTADFIF